MTQGAIDTISSVAPSAAAHDPDLARICELGRLMALSPRDLITTISLDGPAPQLASSPAHDGLGGDLPGPAASGVALARLASIVSALERKAVPARRPSDAALSQLARTPPPLPRVAEIEPRDDDEPMPALSTWRQSAANDEDGWLQQMRAAAWGLIAAVVLIVAALMWLGGWFGGPRAVPKGIEPVPATAAAKTPPQAVGNPQSPVAEPESAGEGDTSPRRTAAAAPGTPAAEVVQPGPVVAHVIAEAKRRVESGDVTGARDILAAYGNDAHGLVPYALAETYDPNMLAAWGTRGIAPDVVKAKALYGEALDLGNDRAGSRLDALQ